uniref:Turripeptide OL49 n=1 Tax=Iotyrris olangoensis TaxID=2420066 RepID=TU49_IOTOL|nr:RecName: Full=Turripeptide OL49 [Iotyrris olangoensis]
LLCISCCVSITECCQLMSGCAVEIKS